MDIYTSIKEFFTLEPEQDCVIDNFVFRLNYRTTSAIIMLCWAFVTATNFVGSPIACLTEGNPEDFIELYCITHSTFTVPDTRKLNPRFKSDEVSYQKYYLWVHLVLFVQSYLFYSTGWIWSSWEGGKVHKLKSISKTALLDYFSYKRGNHNSYAFGFIICEFLSCAHVALQIYLMDRFFDGEFTYFGVKVFQILFLDFGERDDALEKVFPKLVKCTFEKFGSSGTKQVYDSLCLLTMNIINEKIFSALWFWFVFLFVASFLALAYDLASVVSKNFRYFGSRLLEWPSAKAAKKLNFGDWFLLCQLSKNVDQNVFHILLEHIENEL
ncbi:innexin inx2-like [Cimex lectularius]|uniref:Innexin n=1 Tax=Cimex lectularius TaxID=79782 RepID=A0A8I6S611_CIMLE|nr:innexin inx2-like [Cimex lectularius]